MIGKFLHHIPLNGIRLNELAYSKLGYKKNESFSGCMTEEEIKRENTRKNKASNLDGSTLLRNLYDLFALYCTPQDTQTKIVLQDHNPHKSPDPQVDTGEDMYKMLPKQEKYHQ